MTDVSWPIVLSWGITILGWIIVNHRADRRSDAGEVFQMLSSAESLIEEITASGKQIWSMDGKDNEGQKIILDVNSKFSRLGNRLTALAQRDGRFDLHSDFINFKKVVTGQNAESRKRNALPYSDKKFTEIDEAAETLATVLHSTYNEAFNRGRLW